jgi:perosamine synthetase
VKKEIPFERPLIGYPEFGVAKEVLEGAALQEGPRTLNFEELFAVTTNARHSVSTSSCTAAMHLAWMAKGIGPGDEVIVPAMAHVSTAHAVSLTGATPVFIDVELESGNLIVDQLEGAITERTRGIAVVHFLGVPADMKRVMEVAGRHDLFVLEDCAHSLGATVDWRHTGLLGHCGCFSFGPESQITTLEGGMLITDDDDLADRVRRMRALGVVEERNEHGSTNRYDVTDLGTDYRIGELHAAIGSVQLDRLPAFLQKRRENHTALWRGLSTIEGLDQFDVPQGDIQTSFYCLPVFLPRVVWPKRRAILRALAKRGMFARVFYPKSLPQLAYYRERGGDPADFPNAAAIAEGTLAFPVGPHLNVADMMILETSLKRMLKKAMA